MTPEGKVSRFLLELAKRHGMAGPIDLQMSRREMGDYLGLSVELVSRVLSRLAEARYIAIPNVREVEIIDAEALEAIAEAD